MDKLLIGGAIIIISFAVGAIIREGMKLELTELAELIDDLKLMRPCIKLERKTFKELLSYLSGVGKQKRLWLGMLERIESGADSNDAALAIEENIALEKRCLSAAQSYFSSFGRGDAALESEKLEALIALLSETEADMRSERDKRMKLTVPLCVMAGSAAAILIL